MADPVWLLVMFDLPVKTSTQRRHANQYRKLLLQLGFSAVQLSIYSRYFLNATGCLPTLKRVKNAIPTDGAVRVLHLTDSQWSKQDRFFGPTAIETAKNVPTLELFDTWDEP